MKTVLIKPGTKPLRFRALPPGSVLTVNSAQNIIRLRALAAMLSLITALLFLFPMLSLGQRLHPKPLSKAKEPGVENRKTDPQAKKAADNQPKESPEVICNDSVIEQQTGATKVTEDQETSPNGLYQRYLWATIISAGVAVISLCLVFVQIRISRRVADAAVASAAASQESARIAKESADAIRDSESATVLMVNMGKLEFNPYGGSSSTGRVDVQCSHTFNNCGRTQGTVLAIHHELQLGESRDAPPDMGAYDVKRSTTPPFVVAPGLRWEVQSAVKPGGTISVEERDTIYMARKYLWLCGVIRFKDIFQRVWITRFCHLFERTQTKEFWRVAGPPEYNTCVRETDN